VLLTKNQLFGLLRQQLNWDAVLSSPLGRAPPIVAEGEVWSLGYDGRLQAVAPDSGAVQFSTRLSAPVSRFFSLAAAGGRLFVADGTKIVAFSLH